MSDYIEFNQIISNYIKLYIFCIFVFIYSLLCGPGRSMQPTASMDQALLFCWYPGCLVGRIQMPGARSSKIGKYLRHVSEAKLHKESFWNRGFTWKGHLYIKKQRGNNYEKT